MGKGWGGRGVYLCSVGNRVRGEEYEEGVGRKGSTFLFCGEGVQGKGVKEGMGEEGEYSVVLWEGATRERELRKGWGGRGVYFCSVGRGCREGG